MKKTILIVLLLALSLSWAQSPKQASGGFKAENGTYTATGTAEAKTETDAVSQAKTNAVNVVFTNLGKDRLFLDLFLKNPPISIYFDKPAVEEKNGVYRVSVTVSIDDESIRIIYNTVYVATVLNLLDKAEQGYSAIEGLLAQAKDFETNLKFEEAMSSYWQAKDQCEETLSYLNPIQDGSIFSTKEKKKAPELKEIISAFLATAEKGLSRLKSAESQLTQDVEMQNLSNLVDEVTLEMEKTEKYLDSIDYILQSVEGRPRDLLEKTRDDIAARATTLENSRRILDRNSKSIPKEKTWLKSKMDFASLRMSKLTKTLSSSLRLVEREINDPAVNRAQREAQAKWFFLHEPGDYLALRYYLPFGLVTAAENTHIEYIDQLDLNVKAEGAFPFGKWGIWLKTQFFARDIQLYALPGIVRKNTGLSQEIAGGFFAPLLFGFGYTYDWIRTIGGGGTSGEGPKINTVKLMLGGVRREPIPKNDWLLSLSYNLPPWGITFNLLRDLNFGLDLLLRLGSYLVVEGSISKRLYANSETGSSFDDCFAFAVGAAFRLPLPFLWGLEYSGFISSPVVDWVVQPQNRSGQYFRLFIEYTL